jgi:hypothetical protein
MWRAAWPTSPQRRASKSTTPTWRSGEDIAERYRALWAELDSEELIATGERYKIADRISRLNELGFDVEEVDLIPAEGGSKLSVKLRVGGRNYHANRLKELTGVDALEQQARQILSDLYYFQARRGGARPPPARAYPRSTGA